jgi:hypothetical protein
VSDQPQYQCARCQWFDAVDTYHGLCRKDLPRFAGGGSQAAAWPLVFNPKIHWCGQFSPKRHAPWTATTSVIDLLNDAINGVDIPPPTGHTHPRPCSICRREDCTVIHACE